MEALNKLRKLYDGESCKSSWLTRFNWLMTVGLRDKLDKAKRPAVMVHLQKHLTEADWNRLKKLNCNKNRVELLFRVALDDEKHRLTQKRKREQQRNKITIEVQTIEVEELPQGDPTDQ